MGRPKGCSCTCDPCDAYVPYEIPGAWEYTTGEEDVFEFDSLDEASSSLSISISDSLGVTGSSVTVSPVAESGVTTYEALLQYTEAPAFVETLFGFDIYQSKVVLLIDPQGITAKASPSITDGWLRGFRGALSYRPTFATAQAATDAGMTDQYGPGGNIPTFNRSHSGTLAPGTETAQTIGATTSDCWFEVGGWYPDWLGLCGEGIDDLRHSSPIWKPTVNMTFVKGYTVSAGASAPTGSGNVKLSWRFGELASRALKISAKNYDYFTGGDKGEDIAPVYWLDGKDVNIDKTASVVSMPTAVNFDATPVTTFTYKNVADKDVVISLSACAIADGATFLAAKVANPDGTNAGDEYRYINLCTVGPHSVGDQITITVDGVAKSYADIGLVNSTVGHRPQGHLFAIDGISEYNLIDGNPAMTFTSPYADAPTFLSGNDWKYEQTSVAYQHDLTIKEI